MIGNQALWRTFILFFIIVVLPANLGWTEPPASGIVEAGSKNSLTPMIKEWDVSVHLPKSLALVSAVSSSAPTIPEKTMDDEQTLLDEDFENEWPAPPWRVFYEPDSPDVTWGRTDYRAAGGSFGIWCAASGPVSPGPGDPVPANTAAWVTAGPFDLSDTATVDLSFDRWINTEKYYDIFMWLVSTDGVNFTGRATSTNTSGWERQMVSLGDLGGGAAIGSDQVWIAFVYTSDRSNAFEGAYVDNVLMVADAGSQGEEGYTYTTDDDFALGEMIGTLADGDMLQLGREWDTFPFLCVPTTDLGTASRVDVMTGHEVSRYLTGPPGALQPGPIAVDLEGACWVGNRLAGTVVKIGLEDNGGCVDSNGNGRIDTSRDDNGDGAIDSSEVLGWGSDECVVFEVVLAEGSEGVFVPGTNHGLYESNNLLAVAVDGDNDVWVGVADSRTYYNLEGSTGEVLTSIDTGVSDSTPTGAVVDSGGLLWSATWPQKWVLRIDPTTGGQTKVELSHGSQGLALDDDRNLYVTGDSDSTMSVVDLDTESVDLETPVEWSSTGVTVSQDGDLWVAAPDGGNVTRYSNQGVVIEMVATAIGPIAVASDGYGDLWAAGDNDDLLVRIDPILNLVDLETAVGGGRHEATGDLTGIVARNLTTHFGTWTVVYDSLLTDMDWGILTWIAAEPSGTLVTVRARSSNELQSWSTWEQATTDLDLSQTPPGRYLEVQVSMQWVSGETPPSLEQLTVTPAPQSLAPDASFTWSPAEPTAEEPIQYTDTSTEDPTSWSWSFGDDNSSTEANPSHTYTAAGTYVVTLEVSNNVGSDRVSQDVTVAPPIGCTVECPATAPTTGLVEEALMFRSSVTTERCEGGVSWSWDFGDGTTSSAQNTAHAYHSADAFTWTMTATIDDTTCSQTGEITVTETGPEECVNTYWLPVASRAEGASASVWRTDLGLKGDGSGTAAVELRFHGPGGIVTRSLGVATRAMVDLIDVVGWIAGDLQASGPVEVCADGLLTISARTYNLLPETDPCQPGGTFGQYMAGSKVAAGLTEARFVRLTQLRENAGYRTNIGLLNSSAGSAEVEITLFDAYGFELLTYSKSLEAAEWWQDNRPFFNRAGRDDLDAGWARIDVLSGEGVFAYGSVIDNKTNDAMTVPMR